MWQAERVESDEPLRQGDLLRGVVVPILKYPFRVSHPIGEEITNDDRIVLPQRTCDLLVVSQCCTIENNEFLAVARVRPYKVVRELEVQGLMAVEPDGGPYLMDTFRLHPLDGLIMEGAGSFTCADLGSIFTLSGGEEYLRSNRIARMTAVGRRALRIKLSYFWGRPEEEDAAELSAQGLSTGVGGQAPTGPDPETSVGT